MYSIFVFQAKRGVQVMCQSSIYHSKRDARVFLAQAQITAVIAVICLNESIAANAVLFDREDK